MMSNQANFYAHRFSEKDVQNLQTMDISEIRRIRMREIMRVECSNSQKRLAERLDTDRAYMSTLIGINPTRNIGIEIAERAEEEFKKPKGWMSRKLDEHEYRMSVSRGKLDQLMERVPDEYRPILPDVAVPQFSVSASMGPGQELSEEQIVDSWPLNEKVLLKLGITPTQAAIIQVEGNSMLETLHDGDLVIVDRTPIRRLSGKVYVLWSERTGLQAKRVRMTPDGESIEVISDNPNKDSYPTRSYDPETFDETFKVRAKVVKIFMGTVKDL